MDRGTLGSILSVINDRACRVRHVHRRHAVEITRQSAEAPNLPLLCNDGVCRSHDRLPIDFGRALAHRHRRRSFAQCRPRLVIPSLPPSLFKINRTKRRLSYAALFPDHALRFHFSDAFDGRSPLFFLIFFLSQRKIKSTTDCDTIFKRKMLSLKQKDSIFYC